MRLIDADTLIPLIQKDKIEGETLDIMRAIGSGIQAETLNQACDRHIKMLNSLPTVEAEPVCYDTESWKQTTTEGSAEYAPVKHGRWKMKYYCENCKSVVDEDDILESSDLGLRTWYCPVCTGEDTLKAMEQCVLCQDEIPPEQLYCKECIDRLQEAWREAVNKVRPENKTYETVQDLFCEWLGGNV